MLNQHMMNSLGYFCVLPPGHREFHQSKNCQQPARDHHHENGVTNRHEIAKKANQYAAQRQAAK